MTEFLEVEGGRLAYDVIGEGPLVVLAHGMGDNRAAYRGMSAALAAAGHRVASVDLRGHGESSADWPSCTRADSAADLLAVVRRLGGPAVLVGHSFAGGSVTIAAAEEPESVRAIVGISPFTRAQRVDLGGLLTNARYRKGMALLLGAGLFRSVGLWLRYLDHAHPGVEPAGHAEHLAALAADLRRPGRMAVVGRMGMSPPTDAGARLGDIRCPALVVEGSLDPDWTDPRAEGEGVVAAMPPGLGRVEVIEGAGHYPHAQFPAEVAGAVLAFLGAVARG
ncbi:alpha/beta fold hydrolase [Saccharothrix australiensis]|uniref:Pimeloyl-ACP methyl ester carboxylesterase n=1 Tax=Saccharothrix australiensis TaxID=2072 RepID=A0A495VZQ6_9PSEU|nr:alpha/beta hydrolase [Saccharothrix australiensis]RKT54932.1 pimeloyl-ACP methyl ester carboxylesterase [Saccharothrix australiensis]